MEFQPRSGGIRRLRTETGVNSGNGTSQIRYGAGSYPSAILNNFAGEFSMRHKVNVLATKRYPYKFFGQRLLLPVGLLLLCGLTLVTPAAAQSQGLAELSAQGKAALRDQQFDRAEKVYEQVVELDPRSAEAHSDLGLALYMLGTYPRAITELQKALELKPHLDRTQVLLALSYFNTGEFDRAIPLLQKAYQTMQDDPVVAAHLGLAYLRREKDDEALVVLSHWVELEPTSADALYFKGKAAMYVASNSFSQLTKAAPDSYRMLQLRAEMLRQQSLTPAAINEYKKAIAQKPDAAGLHYALGTLYREGGRLDEALAEFQEELKISPNDAMTDFLIGDIHLQRTELDDAQQYLLHSLSAQPGLIEAKLDLAKTYSAQGKVDEAVKLLGTVVASHPNDQDAHYLLFGLYKERGQAAEARKELQIFQELKRKTTEQEQKRMRLDSIN
jgi:tetratricopeptide (TPR) repeat protein